MVAPVALAGVTISVLGGSETVGPWLAVVALTILTPLLVHLARTGWKDQALVVGALVGFAVAIGFRSIDLSVPIAFLPMGTHWLWHTFGAVAVHTLILYIHRSDLREAAVAADEAAGSSAPKAALSGGMTK